MRSTIRKMVLNRPLSINCFNQITFLSVTNPLPCSLNPFPSPQAVGINCSTVPFVLRQSQVEDWFFGKLHRVNSEHLPSSPRAIWCSHSNRCRRACYWGLRRVWECLKTKGKFTITWYWGFTLSISTIYYLTPISMPCLLSPRTQVW